MTPPVVGWDIGGAHTKAVWLDPAGSIVALWHIACPLWLGAERLDTALDTVLDTTPRDARHAVTMTGELADAFATRAAGVSAIADRLVRRVPEDAARLYAGPLGFVAPAARDGHTLTAIASANWLASAELAARSVPAGLFVDTGTTTTDLVPFQGGRPRPAGFTDHDRLVAGEMVYSGVARTPLMALAERISFGGRDVPLMAECFATAADVYRLTGDLPESADPWPAADGGAKTLHGSANRLARMVGLDGAHAHLPAWQELAQAFSRIQLARLECAARALITRERLPDAAPLVVAGAGAFLARRLAERLARPCLDWSSLVPPAPPGALPPARLAPAVAVALLLREALA